MREASLTYDDVNINPQYSNIEHRKNCNTITRVTKNVHLEIPLVSSPMDTVTAYDMSVEMDRLGGMGFLHRFQSPEAIRKQIVSFRFNRPEGSIGASIGVTGDYINEAQMYVDAGAQIIDSASELYSNADIILKVQSATIKEISKFKPEAYYISFMQTTRSIDLVLKMADIPLTAFSMHLIPRTTLAQKMDALSSQANIAGYKAVLTASSRLGKYMPLLMTAAGTIRPSKTLVLGAGVAGLQAIATAKRLGAQVEAFDVRPIVKEQVESLGAKFIEVETNAEDDAEGEGGGIGAGWWAALIGTTVGTILICAVLFIFAMIVLVRTFNEGTTVPDNFMFPEWWIYAFAPPTFLLSMIIFLRWALDPPTVDDSREAQGLF